MLFSKDLISPLAIAPMIDWTYTHFRVFMRLLAPHALLYTEMQTIGAIQNNAKRALMFSALEQPLALQLGGADIKGLVLCAKMAEEAGFVEINLNLGCPSDKVLAGRFGACLMAEPQHVAHCITAMKEAVSIPVTAKTRIGIDKEDSYAFFSKFVHKLTEAGCDKLIVHARKAWLHGLNPKQNRTIPPLHYDFAYRIKDELSHMPVVINGNILSIEDVKQHMNYVDGVMIGRLSCNNPYAIASLHQYFYPNDIIPKRIDIMKAYFEYCIIQFEQGVPLSLLLKPIMNLAHGLAGAKHWKEHLVLAQQKKRIENVALAMAILQESEIKSHCSMKGY